MLDTKYKDVRKNRKPEDVHQLLSYMYLTGARRGGLIFPTQSNSTVLDRSIKIITNSCSFWKDVKGVATWYDVSFGIPAANTPVDQYCAMMQASEKNFLKNVSNILETGSPAGGETPALGQYSSAVANTVQTSAM